MSTYHCRAEHDPYAHAVEVDAPSPREAAEAYVRGGSWGSEPTTITVEVWLDPDYPETWDVEWQPAAGRRAPGGEE